MLQRILPCNFRPIKAADESSVSPFKAHHWPMPMSEHKDSFPTSPKAPAALFKALTVPAASSVKGSRATFKTLKAQP